VSQWPSTKARRVYAALRSLAIARCTSAYHMRVRTLGSAMARNVISVDPQVQGGVPVFAGTRVPVKNLFDYLEAGDTLDQFLADFPSVARDVAVEVLEQARTAVTPHAHPA